jgi:site-specific recombinase XerD
MISIKTKFRPSAISDKEGAVYYQIICDRKIKLITSPYKIFPHEWDSGANKIDLSEANPHRCAELMAIQTAIDNEVRHLKQFADILKNKGENVLDRLPEYYHNHTSIGCFSHFMEKCIKSLTQQGRHKTASTYINAQRSFSEFLCGNDVLFSQLDSNLIKRYETWLKEKGLRLNTVSFYMRILRAVYNKAVEQGLAIQNNPFRQVYTGIEKTVKRAIDEQAIKKLHQIKLSSPNLSFARDMFMLSIYTRGMAFVDMAHLKKSDIREGYLVYSRHKTGQQLNIKMEPCIQAIIDRYSSRTAGSDYLLPVLVESTSYSSALRVQNSRLQSISKILGLEAPLSTYVARHSWASLAKRNGVSVQIISESMGHDNEATTRIYLASLDRSVIDEANAMLLSKI